MQALKPNIKKKKNLKKVKAEYWFSLSFKFARGTFVTSNVNSFF